MGNAVRRLSYPRKRLDYPSGGTWEGKDMDAPEVVADAVDTSQQSETEGMVSMSQVEVDRLKGFESEVSRFRESVDGLTPWMESARASGISHPDEFASIKELRDALPHGLNSAAQIEYVRAIGAGRTPEKPSEPEFDSRAEFEKFKGDMKFESSLEKHKASLLRQNDAFEKRMSEFLGDEPSNEAKFLWRSAGRQALRDARKSTYGRDHPLVDYDLMPLDDDGLVALFKSLDEDRTGFKAAKLVAAGDEANKPKPAKKVTPAGGGGGQGGPEVSQTTSTHGGIIGAKREAAEAQLAARQAARQRAPISSQG